jgi:deazaflavin-dependent oxidoreductase (nitroreductase family)
MATSSLLDRSWPITRQLLRSHTAVYRATRGLIGHHVPGAPPMLLLDHVGAKSGKVRTTPLAYLTDGDDLVIVASKGGYVRNPGWYYNLRAYPEIFVQVGPERRAVRAHVASKKERDRLWPMITGLYSGFAEYQERTDRTIPLVILSPR